MKSIAQLTAHRESIQQAFALVKDAIPAEFLQEVQSRVIRHDIDKYDLIARQDEVQYALHDFRADHHLAYWLTTASIPDAAFLEHVLDHIAVNMDRDCKQFFYMDWFYTGGVFTRDDTSLLQDILAPVTERVRQMYMQKLSKFSEFLVFCEKKLG